MALITYENSCNLDKTDLLPKLINVKNKYANVPRKIWILREDYDKRIKMMVRQEYHDALMAILQWMQKKKEDPTKTYPIVVTPSKALERASDVYPNPFETMGENKNISLRAGGIAIVGLPGIGKSIFLYYIWNLRRHLNLPTLYMPTGETAWVWKENQYFQIQLSSCTKEDRQRFLPENTWCLVDSSQNVVDVPQNVYNTRRFILQASEPRKDGLLWIEKAPIRVTYFAMREWTAAEFIAGLQVQPRSLQVASMDQLVEFWHKFGGSARDAYKNAFQLADYQSSLEHLAKGLTIKSLDRACTPNPSAAQAYPHRLLSVFPLSDDDRTQSNVRPPTPHIMEIIVQALSPSPEKTQVDFFDSLVTSYNIAQRTLAAYFYDRQRESLTSKRGSGAAERVQLKPSRSPCLIPSRHVVSTQILLQNSLFDAITFQMIVHS
ncbi:hypothetical protein BT96DRAFT_998339 [Gymnopus androsaceus JB14]|uniref:Uncharacterized protein n=1 Tax=Gymnopus androsaceus JB14 TaxID=1447944 RepID=A0A6A4H982_9AGAR|nr:hypothetical protein BT96DRAFT_998339 [Gymnopus androsaceus JB14]